MIERSDFSGDEFAPEIQSAALQLLRTSSALSRLLSEEVQVQNFVDGACKLLKHRLGLESPFLSLKTSAIASSSGSSQENPEFRFLLTSAQEVEIELTFEGPAAWNSNGLRELMIEFLNNLGSCFFEFLETYHARKLQQRQAEALNYSNEAVVTLDLETRIEDLNSAAEQLLLVPIEDARGRDFRDFWPTAGRDFLNRLQREGQIRNLETAGLNSRGETIQVELSASLRFNDQGQPLGYIGTLRDISQRKHLENILFEIHRATSNRFGDDFFHQLVSRLGPLLNVDFALVSRIDSPDRASTLAFWANGEKQENFSYQLMDLACEEVVAQRSSSACQSGVRDSFPGSRFFSDTQAEGFVCVPVLDEASRVLGLVSIVHRTPLEGLELIKRVLEVFAGRVGAELIRKEEARKTRELSERLGLAVEAGRLGIWDWDPVKNELIWDQRMLEIYGISQANFHGNLEDWAKWLHPEDRDDTLQLVQAALENRQTFHPEFRIVRPDGSCRYIKAHAVVVLDDSGEPLRMTGMNVDVTEQREAELEKENLQAQLYHSQKMDSIGRLAGGMAHDFNNMLGVIIGNVELALLEAEEHSPMLSDLREIASAAQRSADLTHQLLAFAREQKISPISLEINPVVEAVFKMLERLMGERITLLWKPGADLWPILADPTQIDQILMNLCINARDAIVGEGQVIISTQNRSLDARYVQNHPGSTVGNFVELTVIDSGCGMTEEVRQKVFDPFFTTKGHNQGTGLGMSTVYGIVKQNNGYIDIQSAPDQGTVVTVLLPRYLGEPTTRRVSVQSTTRGTETILLVEDHKQVLRIAKRMLENLGYKVHGATNPCQALDLVEKLGEPIELLITDVMMPGMNGKELAETLLNINPSLKCLFMSGYTGDILSSRGILDDGLDFISKPFSQTQLAEKVRTALSG